ncbi:MAG: hypothetical protein AABZ06_04245 [Bdellovibrionota bacterium]
MDIAIGGYCLGISSVHAFMSMNAETRKKVFGETINNWFIANPAQNYNAAHKLLRVFSILQMESSFQIINHQIEPLITTNTIIDGSPDPLLYMQAGFGIPIGDTEKDLEKTSKHLLELYNNPDFFLDVAVASKYEHGHNLIGYHSLYVYSANKLDDLITFYYVDPNLPRTPLKMTYNLKTHVANFETDTIDVVSLPIAAYTKDQRVGAYETTIHALKESAQNGDALANIKLSFLRLPGGTYFEQCGGISCDFSDPTVLNFWINAIPDVQVNKPDNDMNDKIIKQTAQAMSIMLFTAQEQLDQNHDHFEAFLWQLLERVISFPKTRQSWKDYAAQISSREFALVMLIGTIATWAVSDIISDSSDGNRVGLTPPINTEQSDFLRKNILPNLIQNENTPLKKASPFWAISFPQLSYPFPMHIWLYIDYLANSGSKHAAKLFLQQSSLGDSLLSGLLMEQLFAEGNTIAETYWKILFELQNETMIEWTGSNDSFDYFNQRGPALYSMMLTLVNDKNTFQKIKKSSHYPQFLQWFDRWISFLEKHDAPITEIMDELTRQKLIKQDKITEKTTTNDMMKLFRNMLPAAEPAK